ncbi:16S rRNA (cytidine(1402)-2'-O)-methyltransferase [Streptomyces sp. 4N509B]|uniref:16S rRNA (cytidine(1402)-2'-O)-methyltransferase n=1 Tax=Streptomyces sp. 4N509B TaxID=3457413 RepID=UPI003FD44C58
MPRASATGDDRPAAVEELARRILAAGKYRHLDEGFVHRLAGEALDRCRDRTQALKYAKRKLHQAFGAFLTGQPAEAVAAVGAAVTEDRLSLRDACRTAMRAHASSAERLADLEAFYEQVAAWCGTPRSVVDLACGLNPLAMPWMRLAPDCSYWFCDVDASLVAALRGLETVLPAARLTGEPRDLVAAPPRVSADVALVLKTLTTVEQQSGGAAGRILAALDCEHVVVSLPRRSLSGRREYTDDARAMLQRAAEGSPYHLADEAHVGDELLCHLTREPAGAHDAGPVRADAGDDAPAEPPGGDGAGADPPGDEARAGGVLTLVGTPLGNLSDLGGASLRALREADVVCAEDTRRTRKLLSAFDIHPARLVSVRAHNERAQSARVLRWLDEGLRVAFATDAGMPTVSDPGYELARHVLDAGREISVAAGPDAATTALALAGMPADRWCFEGFLPVRGGARTRRLADLAAEPRTMVLYEAPHRLLGTLADLAAALGPDREAAVLNDMTKRYERVWRGPLATLTDHLATPPPRGEFALVVAGRPTPRQGSGDASS